MDGMSFAGRIIYRQYLRDLDDRDLNVESDNFHRLGVRRKLWMDAIEEIDAELGRRALSTEQSHDLAGHIWRSRDG